MIEERATMDQFDDLQNLLELKAPMTAIDEIQDTLEFDY